MTTASRAGTCLDVDMSDVDSIITQHGSVMSTDTPFAGTPFVDALSVGNPSVAAPLRPSSQPQLTPTMPLLP